MSFGYSTKQDDVSLKLRAQNMRNTKKQTSQLELDNKRMEERLMELKIAMNNEKEEREKNQGKNFWQSGQQGNLGNYANDVLTKSTKRNKERKKKVKILKDEPIAVPERNKGPGSMKYIADRNSGGKENHRLKGPVCGQCEIKASHVSCLECGEDYCASCFAAFHMKGALKKHRSIPVGAGSARTPRSISSANSERGYNNNVPMVGDGRTTPTDVSLIMDSTRSPLSSAASVRSNSSNYSSQKISNDRSKNGTDNSLLDGQYDERQAHDDFQQALAEWRTGKKNAVNANYSRQEEIESRANEQTGSLLEGTYDEKEAAADFQKALSEWRSGGKQVVKQQKPKEQVVCFDEGIGTDLVYDKQPVEIKFSSTLTYAEKLMLKRFRRQELASLDALSSTSMSSHDDIADFIEPSSMTSGFQTPKRLASRPSSTRSKVVGDFREQYEDRPHLFSSDVEVIDQQAIDSELAASRVDVGTLFGSVKRPSDDSDFMMERSESRVSIIELGATENRRSMKGLESTSYYEVTEVIDPPQPSALARAKSAKFWEVREAFKTPHTSAKYPRAQPEPLLDESLLPAISEPNQPVAKEPNIPKRSRSAKRPASKTKNSTDFTSYTNNAATISKSSQEESNQQQTFNIQNSFVKDDTSIDTEDGENEKVSTATSGRRLKGGGAKTTGDYTSTVPKSRPQSRMKSARERPQSRAKSRAESRVSFYGEGALTKQPSSALQEIASLARQVTTEIVANSEYTLGLGDFFLAGVESPVHIPELERTLTPSKNRPVSSRSRPGSSLNNRPKSSKQQVTGDMEKWKISNKLYSMTPRSWKPDFSLADTISDVQVQDHVTDDNVVNIERLAQETLASLAEQKAGDDHLVLSEVGLNNNNNSVQERPHSSKSFQSSSYTSSPNQGVSDTKQYMAELTPSRPQTASGRESRMIVMEGEDLSTYDRVEEQDTTIQDDNEALDKLEWELASQSGLLTDDGRVSRLLDDVEDEDSDAGNNEQLMYETQKSWAEMTSRNKKDVGFDIQNHLRESELMDDFEEMEAAIMGEEQEVKNLM